MNNQRRIPRGIGGRPHATDGRLPAHNARRRKQPPPTSRNKTQSDNNHEATGNVLEVGELEIVEASPVEQAPIAIDASSLLTTAEQQQQQQSDQSSKTENASEKEMQHLRNRIQKVQESIQLSHAITEPHIYQTNVLNVVTKAVNEWRAIVNHHFRSSDILIDGYTDDPSVKDVTLLVFGLLQYSLQCGPLAGAKPGYFKRCGSDVAAMVVRYLDGMGFDKEEEICTLGFSQKQTEAIQTWRKNAQNAADAGKPPSKSALKARQGKGKKK
jgi:hypothetical protein